MKRGKSDKANIVVRWSVHSTSVSEISSVHTRTLTKPNLKDRLSVKGSQKHEVSRIYF